MRAPAYFLSHGGPDVMYNTKHAVFPVLQRIGREITEKVKPKAVVVFSAHWEGSSNSVLVNNAEHTDLIYDFYGFPSSYYKAQYPSVGSPALANEIIDLLKEAGIQAQGVKRGLDHGVWAGFHVAFDPETNPLRVPLVQVSLYANEDADAHYRLGRAVASLRERNVVIVGAGMSVHNLRDMRFAFADPRPQPYAVSFDGALRDAVLGEPQEQHGRKDEQQRSAGERRRERLAALLERPDARKAHPTFDHLLPIHVVAGAAGDDAGELIWTMQEASFAWAQYRFGEVPS